MTKLVFCRLGWLPTRFHPVASETVGPYHVQPLEIFSFSTTSWSWLGMGQLRSRPIPIRNRGPLPSQGRRPVHPHGQKTRLDSLGVRLEAVAVMAANQRPQLLGPSRRREVPGTPADQDRPWLDMALLVLLQDPVRERRAIRRYPQLRPMPLMRDSPAGPDWRTTDDEGGNR